MSSTDTGGDSEFGDRREAMLGLGGASTGIHGGEGEAIRPRGLSGREGRKILKARGCRASKIASKGREPAGDVNTGGSITPLDVQDRGAPAVDTGWVSTVQVGGISEVT